MARTTAKTCVVMILAGLASSVAARDTAPVARPATVTPGKTLSCVPLSQIDSTTVLDDKTILFKMRSGTPRYYKNNLPFKCPQLGSEKAFSYKTSTSQLCNVDIVTVLLNFGGHIQDGASCGLGKFEPYTPPEKIKK